MSNKHISLCPVAKCGTKIEAGEFMCPAHWAKVPVPVQDQVQAAWHKANYGAYRQARAAAIKSIESQLPLLLLILILLPGCMVARYSRTPAGWNRLPACCTGPLARCSPSNTNQTESVVCFTLWSCLMNEKAVKISVDKFTGKTHSGITIGSIDSTVDDDALKAIVSAAVETTIKAFLGL